ncbi:MAG: TonB family protein [Cyanobacteria bacterium P01_H01_bin.74]
MTAKKKLLTLKPLLNALCQRKTPSISGTGKDSAVKTLSLKLSMVFSVLMHLLLPVAVALSLIVLGILISWLFHFNLWEFFFPPPFTKKQPIEFVLVQDNAVKESPKNTRRKGKFNQLAGGKRQKNMPVNPEDADLKQATLKKITPQKSPPQADEAIQPKSSDKPLKNNALMQKPVSAQTKPTQPNNPASPDRPEKNSTPLKQKQQMAKMPSKTSSKEKTPPQDQILQAQNQLNPETGKNKEPGVAVAQEKIIGAVMHNIEKKIKQNWVPPRDSRSRQVMVLFYLSREGTVLRVDIKKSSGEKTADAAALNAVKAASPFKPLPAEIVEPVLPVEFTFDYNVLSSP